MDSKTFEHLMDAYKYCSCNGALPEDIYADWERGSEPPDMPPCIMCGKQHRCVLLAGTLCHRMVWDTEKHRSFYSCRESGPVRALEYHGFLSSRAVNSQARDAGERHLVPVSQLSEQYSAHDSSLRPSTSQTSLHAGRPAHLKPD